MGEPNLEIETGRFRYKKIPNCIRYCRYCAQSSSVMYIDDERHALSECERARDLKRKVMAEITMRFEDENVVPAVELVWLHEAIPHLKLLTLKAQRKCWKSIGVVINAIETTIAEFEAKENQGNNS